MIDMRFATVEEVTAAQSADNPTACGYSFGTAAQAYDYLAIATQTWRNPEWAAQDRKEQIAADVAGMCEFYS